MFGGKKKPPSTSDGGRRKGSDLMNQMGFGEMAGLGDIDAMVYGGDDDDDDLEAELAALVGQSDIPKKAKPRKRVPVPMTDIESLAQMGMADVDEDVSDTEDPDLLNELAELQADVDEEEEMQIPHKQTADINAALEAPSGGFNTQSSQHTPKSAYQAPPIQPQKAATNPSPSPSSSASGGGRQATGIVGLLEERLDLYKSASANAKTSGDSSKQRRLDRGIKTLTGLLRQAKSGKQVDEEEIPPAVALGASIAASSSDDSKPTPMQEQSSESLRAHEPEGTRTTPTQKHPNASTDSLAVRREQYKTAALAAKRAGDIIKAGSYVKVAKQFDAVIQAIEEGKEVDLTNMPPPPTECTGESSISVSAPQSNVPIQRAAQQAAGEEPEPDLPSMSAEEEKTMFDAPEAPKTVMEALTQRLQKYKSSESQAKTDGESSKARRMGRIVKQYEDAIKAHRAGRTIDFEELPTPPGFAAIPVGQAGTLASPSSGSGTPSATSPSQPTPPSSSSSRAPQQVPHTSPQSGPSTHATTAAGSTAGAAKPHAIQRQNTGRKSMTSRQEQQLAFLKERMGEFKQAAMQAKKNHDIEMAKKYVRLMKGMEPMIDACECGLPVNLSQVPPSPIGTDDAEDKFVVVNAEDCEPTGDREEVYKSLQADLVKQIRMCVANAQHYQKLGDVPAASRFQKLEQNCRKDLDSLKSAYRHSDPAPRFHYETRTFSMVQCNTELGDADMELTVVRGIQYNLPSGYSEKDMDTFVKYEFAYPTDDPQAGGTGTVKDTINPEYNETFRLQINRKSKGLFRYVERKGIKIEVFIKRGFFKGDKLLGTVNIKLQPLESNCTVHDSYDLMDGRKTAGGKLEVKLRIRDPLKSKQVEEVREKWLVIDQFIRTVGSKSQVEAKASKPVHEGTQCMEVLRLEKQMLDKQINQLKDSLSVTQTQALRHKSSLIEEKLELQQKKLREGGLDAWKAYLSIVKREAVSFEQEARQYVKFGEVQKAEIFMTKKKYAEKEITAITSKLQNAG